ncbi:site-specific DNA-methyltransferase [candidate division KSB1 bacterium]|nr:site-specific DNA-methyltransferase [candidate division KSB1 bacterium]
MQFERGSTQKARSLTEAWLNNKLASAQKFISLGLPEYDDRFKKWRVPLHLHNGNNLLIGEVFISEKLDDIIDSTNIKLVRKRIEKYKNSSSQKNTSKKKLFYPATVPNKVVLGNSIDVLEEFPPDTAQLVFTSPPYYNAKPEYSEYVDYQEYLDFMRKVIKRVHSILSDGRFFVINISPVLIRRTSRATSSKRLPIPFDLHQIFDNVGFDFIDDIIWVKPEGAGWNLGRGRRFKADRQPLQYKPVPVTEYVLVYRKKTDKLIDWNLRKHHDPTLIDNSKILGDYDVTNVWKIHPGHSKIHPAVFPDELAKKVIRYYSFEDDLVLDPFAGTGTVGKVAYSLNRRFLLIENEAKYYKYMKDTLSKYIPISTRVDFDINEKFKKEMDEYKF